MTNMRIFLCYMGMMVIFGAPALGASFASGEYLPAGINLSKYPKLDRKEVGHLRYTYKIVSQDLDDFSLIPSGDILGLAVSGHMQSSMASYRYSLAFMTYFLALEQFHKVPANTGMIKPLMERLIQKMQRKAVWDYWGETSKGMPHFEPNLDRPYLAERDPIKHKNIMYSGHLAQMIGLYEKLYADFKWSAPGAIEFVWSDQEKYVYDQNTLMKVIYDQFINMPDHCIQCEPNACFPVCNQHPLLALMLYDQAHGTRLFEAASPLVLNWMEKTGMIDAKTHEVAIMWLIKQKRRLVGDEVKFDSILDHFFVPLTATRLIKFNSAAVDGWNGVFMNAWQADLVKRDYPFQVKNHVKINDAGSAMCIHDGVMDQLATPFFALLVAEMGDLTLRNQLLHWSEQQFKAQWDVDGGYFYPPSMELPISFIPGLTHKGIALTDKAAAMARADVKDGVRNLHTQPFAGNDQTLPRVENHDFPNVVFTRAIFDKEKQALIISTAAGLLRSGSTTLVITRLDPTKTWTLFVDGVVREVFSNKDAVKVLINLSNPHDLIILASSPS